MRERIEQKIQGALTPQDPQVSIRLNLDDANQDWRKKSEKRIKYVGHTIYQELLLEKINNTVLLLSAPASVLLLLLYLLPILSSVFVAVLLPISCSLGALWLVGNKRMNGFKKLGVFALILMSLMLAHEIDKGDLNEIEPAISSQMGARN